MADIPSPYQRKTVCFGDSITYGMVSASYITLLEERLGPAGFRFVNAGVNNDMTDNLLRRVPAVAAENPDFVTVLVGTNDVIASLSYQSALFYILRKRIYRWPNLNGSVKRLTRLVKALKAETGAKIGLASVPVLGEDLDSRPMQRVRRWNAHVREIAAREGVTYLPVFERQEAYLSSLAREDLRVYPGSARETARLLAHRLFLREDYDAFAARMGYEVLVDGVHMNCKGAELIAGVLEGFLRQGLPETQAQAVTAE